MLYVDVKSIYILEIIVLFYSSIYSSVVFLEKGGFIFWVICCYINIMMKGVSEIRFCLGNV